MSGSGAGEKRARERGRLAKVERRERWRAEGTVVRPQSIGGIDAVIDDLALAFEQVVAQAASAGASPGDILRIRRVTGS